MKHLKTQFLKLFITMCAIIACSSLSAYSAAIFIRCNILTPASGSYKITTYGHVHNGASSGNWYLPSTNWTVTAGTWTDWKDLSGWTWPGRQNLSGGLAEWPSMRLTVTDSSTGKGLGPLLIRVQLANAATDTAVKIDFTETSVTNQIYYLVPNPLATYASEFETGRQMADRQLAWAQEATFTNAAIPSRFRLISTLYGLYEPYLANSALQTLRQLGIKATGGTTTSFIRDNGMVTFNTMQNIFTDPDIATAQWTTFTNSTLKSALATEIGQWQYQNMPIYTLSDEVKTLSFSSIAAAKRDGWFRDYLVAKGVSDSDLPTPVDQAVLETNVLATGYLSRTADLPTRRLHYWSSKFAQWWSARQFRHNTDLIQGSLPGMETETLVSDHSFLYFWGAPWLGMANRNLDQFELGSQQSVTTLAAEDWLGLNHMYGYYYTASGGQTFGWMSAIMRSAMLGTPGNLMGLITPSDDKYLRLKAYSNIGQGSKTLYYWTFSPTYIGTENYWSDLKSMYFGIAKTSRALVATENILYPAKTVSDRVAILYSVSHDLWNVDSPSAFSEKRLSWHALRHLSVQPDYLSEDAVVSGRLSGYDVLYVHDWCVSRAASAAIDAWVRAGGVLYLSAGAATRDEFYEPYVPPFAANLWPANAALNIVVQSGVFIERRDLSSLSPLTTVTLNLGTGSFSLPAIGARLTLRSDVPAPFATFADGTPAGVVVNCDSGRVVAVGFMPMLAYGRQANFQATTLAEVWPSNPRQIIARPLQEAGIDPVVKSSAPVVEANLLAGTNGNALVLANYTYHAISNLVLDIRSPNPTNANIASVYSSELGTNLPFTFLSDRIRVQLPLDWTDILTLPLNTNGPPVRFTADQYQVPADANPARVTILRTVGGQSDIIAHYTARNGTAVDGVDYTAISGTVVLAGGSTTNSFVVPLLNERLAGNKTVLLTVWNSPTGGLAETRSSAVLTLVGHDPCGLQVNSDWGVPTPPSGASLNLYKTVITNSVTSPDTRGWTQYVCTGWALTGNEPLSGETNRLVMTLTNAAILTWQWKTQYWMDVSQSGMGEVIPHSDWVDRNASAVVTALPSNYYRFVSWTGTLNSVSNPLPLTMNQAHGLMAVFAEVLAANQTPEWWLAYYGLTNDGSDFSAAETNDSDRDGVPAWQEQIAGTDPTNHASFLAITNLPRPDNSSFVIAWPSASNRIYGVDRATNLVSPGFESIASNIPASPPMNVHTDMLPGIDQIFYRITVEKR
jgi:hypothetical protein